jgi:hypothetical protein
MKTPYKTLGQFLAELNLTEQKLKQLTGITIPRLRAIYKAGQISDDDFIKFDKALSARRAVKLVYASQIGYINQNGIGNKQEIVNNFITIIMRRLGAIPGFHQPRLAPFKQVLVGSVQQHALDQLPGSQVTQVNSLAPTVTASR